MRENASEKGTALCQGVSPLMSLACLLPLGTVSVVGRSFAKRISGTLTGTRAQKMNLPNPRERIGSWRSSAPVLLAVRGIHSWQ